MTSPLAKRIATSLTRQIRPEVQQLSQALVAREDAQAVLFYGSNLRTGSLDGVLDFYLLTGDAAEARIWPRVSYREFPQPDGTVLRAKIASMSLRKFASAAAGKSRDTTIWSRFVQPAALVWASDDAARDRTAQAMTEAAKTAARLAAALHESDTGTEREFWQRLFQETYRAEFRVEKAGRENDILDRNAQHFDGLLSPALAAQGIEVEKRENVLTVNMMPETRAQTLRWWRKRQRMGKALNLMRLAKATTTFEGAARYGAWKLERHSGIHLDMTGFRERHPILAAPGAWLEYRRKKKAGGK